MTEREQKKDKRTVGIKAQILATLVTPCWHGRPTCLAFNKTLWQALADDTSRVPRGWGNTIHLSKAAADEGRANKA